MARGALTAQTARRLQEEFNGQGFDVLYDHGKKGIDPNNKLGKLHSYFKGVKGSRKILADLDIALVSRNSKKIHVLVEIEEKTCKPKAILGDVLATLLGSGILFRGKPELKVWKGTTFIVMAHDAHQSQHSRTKFLERKINDLKTNLSTPNARVGEVIIDTFVNAEDLGGKLGKYISKTIDLHN